MQHALEYYYLHYLSIVFCRIMPNATESIVFKVPLYFQSWNSPILDITFLDSFAEPVHALNYLLMIQVCLHVLNKEFKCSKITTIRTSKGRSSLPSGHVLLYLAVSPIVIPHHLYHLPRSTTHLANI